MSRQKPAQKTRFRAWAQQPSLEFIYFLFMLFLSFSSGKCLWTDLGAGVADLEKDRLAVHEDLVFIPRLCQKKKEGGDFLFDKFLSSVALFERRNKQDTNFGNMPNYDTLKLYIFLLTKTAVKLNWTGPGKFFPPWLKRGTFRTISRPRHKLIYRFYCHRNYEFFSIPHLPGGRTLRCSGG